MEASPARGRIWQAIRWALVLPSSFVAAGLASTVWLTVRHALAFIDPESGTVMNRSFEGWMDGTLTGIAFVWAGATVAPKGRAVTATVLSALFLIQWTYFIDRLLRLGGSHAWFGIIGGMVSAVVVPIAYWRAEIEKTRAESKRA